MNKQLMKYYLFLSIALLGCHSKDDKKQAQTLLTLWATEEQSGKINLEFMSDNTIHFKNAAPYLNEIPNYTLSNSQIAKRDSFIHLMLSIKRQEFYNDIDNCFETHQYSISINSVTPNKEIKIAGHKAPKKYYDFVFWALALRPKS